MRWSEREDITCCQPCSPHAYTFIMYEHMKQKTPVRSIAEVKWIPFAFMRVFCFQLSVFYLFRKITLGILSGSLILTPQPSFLFWFNINCFSFIYRWTHTLLQHLLHRFGSFVCNLHEGTVNDYRCFSTQVAAWRVIDWNKSRSRFST